jgi:hypothetical protein
MSESRYRNGIRKTKERTRRDARMMETIKKGKLPYAPAVMSWLSEKLGKRSSLLTQAEVSKLAKA